jgi:cysteine-rich repeat protein
MLPLVVFCGCAGNGTMLCGDGYKEPFEQCDDGNRIDGDGCSAQCTIETPSRVGCGNGVRDGLEECDDNNLTNGDGCSSTCTIETTGPIQPTLASIQHHVFTPICSLCHYASGFMPLDTYWDSYDNLVGVPAYTCAEPRVHPGDPDGSCIVLKIKGLAAGDVMPPSPIQRLTQEQTDAIREWIRRGALH